MLNQDKSQFTKRFGKIAPAILFSVALSFSLISSKSFAQVPDVPFIAANNVAPNIMFILDDSGSMNFEYTPDELHSDYQFNESCGWVRSGWNWVWVCVPTTPQYFWYYSSHVNKSYYDPNVTYSPPFKADETGRFNNASYTSARINGYNTSSTSYNLSNNFTIGYHRLNANFTSITSSGFISVNTGGFYYRYNPSAANAASCQSNPKQNKCYTYVSMNNATEQEKTNFANWYSFYRSRLMASKAGIGEAFSSLPADVRVGWGAINSNPNRSDIDGASVRAVEQGVRPFASNPVANQNHRLKFFNWLYNKQTNGGTPLRRALEGAGRYYELSDIPWSTDTSKGKSSGMLGCRQSYTVLMTDGYWNGSDPVNCTGNQDGTDGHVISFGQVGDVDYKTYQYKANTSNFSDSYENTLADVAMCFWKRDLRSDIDNKVPSTKQNPAFWQHMVTYGVALGVDGKVNVNDAFAGKSVNWGDPHPSTNTFEKIDDLVHAAVNSRGGFFSAADPITFRDELTKTLQQIVARSGSGGAIAVNSNTIQNEGATRAFAASFNSENWSGDVLAYSITESGVQTTPLWSAASRLDTRSVPRVIYMGEGSIVNQQPSLLTWATMTAAQKTALGSEAILNYLKGTRSGERRNGGSLRNRDSILGDIVHSAPVYNRDLSTLFVAANDGFLHAFDAVTGDERFAFLPKGVDLAQLKTLADENYTHKYFVDGEIVVTEKVQTAGKNILVGALGRGGKGLYALDVTNPSEPKYLWELNTADADMGKVLGSIVYIQLADGTPAVMVGNGYESDSGFAALFVIDIFTGNIIKKIAIASGSGLSTPTAFFAENQLHVYAGDLLGNVWKFDLSDADEDKWGVSYGTASVPAPLFVAKDKDGKVQPITAPISVAVNNSILYPNAGKRFVFFGTGSYFKSGDPNDSSTQTWYGIIDDGFQVTGRSQLNAGGVEKKANNLGYDVRSFKLVDDANLVNKKGWYIDLLDGTKKEGERIVTRSNLYYLAQPVLIASSIIPSVDPCEPGGSGYVNAINPFTGGNVTRPIFMVGSEYLIVDPKSDPEGSDIYAGSVRLRVGMPGEAVIVGNQLVAGGSDAKVESIELDLGASPENKRVLWMELIR